MSSEKTEKSTELSLTNLTLDNVPELLTKVRDQIKSLTSSDAQIKNEILLKDLGAGFKQPLKKINKLSTLIFAFASITERNRLYDEATKEMELSKDKFPKFTLAGHTSEEWKAAIKMRYNEVYNSKALDKLRTYEDTLKKYESKEQQFKSDAAAMLKDLGAGVE